MENILYFCFGLSKAKVEQAEEVGRITVIKVWVEMAAADKDTIDLRDHFLSINHGGQSWKRLDEAIF